MKYLQTLLILSFIGLLNICNGQDPKAKAILDELSNKTRQYQSITSDFTFTLDDKASDVHQTQKGTLKMKGEKYYIKLGNNQIYSDGETRWTFSEEMNEVYIDFADGGEDALNPSKIYTVWESGFKHFFEGEVTEGGITYQVIKLVPNKPEDKTFHTVKVYVNKAKQEVGKIEIFGKQGDNYTYTVNSFKTDIPYNANTFVFNKADHPGVETVDNR